MEIASPSNSNSSPSASSSVELSMPASIEEGNIGLFSVGPMNNVRVTAPPPLFPLPINGNSKNKKRARSKPILLTQNESTSFFTTVSSSDATVEYQSINAEKEEKYGNAEELENFGRRDDEKDKLHEKTKRVKVPPFSDLSSTTNQLLPTPNNLSINHLGQNSFFSHETKSRLNDTHSGHSAPSVAGVPISFFTAPPSPSNHLRPNLFLHSDAEGWKSAVTRSASLPNSNSSGQSNSFSFASSSSSSSSSTTGFPILTPTSSLANTLNQVSLDKASVSLVKSSENSEEIGNAEAPEQNHSPNSSSLECTEELEPALPPPAHSLSKTQFCTDDSDNSRLDTNDLSTESFDSTEGIREPPDNFSSTLDEQTRDSYNSDQSSSSITFTVDTLPIDPHCLALLNQTPSTTIVTLSSILDSLDQDCLNHMYENEKIYHPSRDYLDHQPHLDAGMRPVLLDWMIEVAQEFGLQRESVALAINYVDRFLSYTPANLYPSPTFTSVEIEETLKNSALPHSTHLSIHLPVTRSNLQLLGITCLLIACKLEEIYSPTAHDFATTTDGAYSFRHIDSMERVILDVLRWKLHAITPVAWVKVYLKKICLLIHDEYEQKKQMLQELIVKKRSEKLDCEDEEKELILLTQTFTNTLEYYLNVHLFTRCMEHLDQVALDMHSLTFYPSALAASSILLVYAQTLTPTLISAVSGYSIDVLTTPLIFIEPYTHTPYRGVYNHHIYFPDVPDRLEERYCKQVHFIGAIELLEKQLAIRENSTSTADSSSSREPEEREDEMGSMGISMISIAAETSMMDTNSSSLSARD